MQQPLDRAALQAIAACAGLDLSEERLDALLPEVQRLLPTLERLRQVDVGGAEPDGLGPSSGESL